MLDLKNLPLLAAATDAEGERLHSKSRVVTAQPGDTLFPDFAITDAYWILIEGTWRVTRRVAGFARVMFEADRPGSWTGGISIIDAIAPPKAEVLKPSTFLKVPISTFETVAARNPQVAKRLPEALNWGSGHIGGLIPEVDETA